MKKTTLKNIFKDLPEKRLDKEIFETLLQNNNVKLERIISTGQTTPKGEWYDQERDEWVILLQGHATLVFENEREINLKPGDYVFIKAHKKHRVSLTSSDEVCVWLAAHIGEMVLKNDK